MSRGIDAWPQPLPASNLPIAADRVVWWLSNSGSEMSTNAAANFCNTWTALRGPQSQVTNGGGSAFTLTMFYQAGLGRYLHRANGAGASFMGQIFTAPLLLNGDPMNAATGTRRPRTVEVIIVKEEIRFLPDPPGGAAAVFGGGFMIGNISSIFGGMAAATLMGSTVVRFVGMVYRGGAWTVTVKNSPAQFTDYIIPGYNGLVMAVIEHRLYMPTESAPGRYELRVNGSLAVTVPGTHAHFPQVQVKEDRYMYCPFIRANNAHPFCGVQCMVSEVYAGPNTASTING